jgi:hypothetical protein
MSKITIAAKFGSKEVHSLFGRGHDWTDIDKDLLRLAEFQGGKNARRVELVFNLLRANVGASRGGERKGTERNRWIQRASRYAFPKFSQVGKIDFILPLPVSGPMIVYVHVGGIFTSTWTMVGQSSP